jgi:DNA polymerase-3 subunit gamma/tau
LLKTLEEPPSHVIFVLATTEPHKIPDTVISRCETYTFKTPNREVLKKMVKKTAKAEGIKLDSGALDLITILGDGSFRDTHTILQKMLRSEAFSNDKEITVEEVEKATGAPKSILINDVLKSIVTGEVNGGLKAVKLASENNMDAKVFMKLLLEKYRSLLMLKLGVDKDIYDISEDDLGLMQSLVGEGVDSVKLLKLLSASSQVGKSYLPYLPIEVVLVECGK